MENLFIAWDVGYTWVDGSEFLTGGTGGQQHILPCLEVRLSSLISICQGLGLKVSLDLYVKQIQIMLNIIMGSSTSEKLKKHVTLTWMNSLIHHGLMYWTKV